MKLRRSKYLALLVLLVILLAGCTYIQILPADESSAPATEDISDSPDTSAPDSAGTSSHVIADYFPFVANQTMVYEGFGNEYAAYTAYPDYISDSRMQLRTSNGGTETIKVLENSGGKLTVVLAKSEIYYKTNLCDAEADSGEVLLAEPLVVGTTWTLPDGSTRTITGVSVPVATPYGDFNALEVTTTYADSVTRDYYVLNTGLVKSVFESGDTTVRSELSSILEGGDFVIASVALYYPENTDTDTLVSVSETSIHLKTNEDIHDYFSESFITRGMMSPQTKINALSVDDASGIATIDFSSSFLTEMNAGSDMEGAIIQSVVNTVGAYFEVSQVIITIDGANYSSGHFFKEKGEWFDTDF